MCGQFCYEIKVWFCYWHNVNIFIEGHLNFGFLHQNYTSDTPNVEICCQDL